MADTYGISRYRSRFDKGKKLQVQHLEWDEVVDLLTSYKTTDETYEEFMAMDSVAKLNIKDVGYFVGGVFDPPQRKTFNLVSRSLLTLDLDHLEPFDEAEIKAAYGKFAYVVHSSHSHNSDAPRLRIVFPLSREVTPEEYEPLARKVAERMGMDFFDDTTYQFSRVMFLPSVSSDGETYTEVNEGSPLSVDKILALYEDADDFTQWPRSSREGKIRPSAAKAENAYTKGGIIGAFNRSYNFAEAVEAFGLPYVESGAGQDRYSFIHGTSADGCCFYVDDGHLFSWHESDPAQGNHHVFDLVRIFKFVDPNDPAEQSAPCGSRPSDKAMAKFAAGLPEVAAELRKSQAETDFEELGDEDEDNLEGTLPKQKEEISGAMTFHQMMEMIEHFQHEHDTTIHDQCDKLILELAVARLEPHEEERALVAFQSYAKQNGSPYTKAVLMNAVKSKTKALVGSGHGDNLQDIQIEFINHFLDKWYEGGQYLKRTGSQWWAFKGTHWSPRADEYIKGQLATMLSDLRTNPKSRKKSKELAAAVGENQTSAILSSLWVLLCSKVTQDTEQASEADPLGMMRVHLPPAINCLSGTLKYKKDGTFKILDHNPEDMNTFVVNGNYEEGTECPAWMKFCAQSFAGSENPADMQRHLEELLGYVCNQSRNLRAWVLFYGLTGSGKSTVKDFMLSLMGDSAKSMRMGNYGGNNSHASAALVGKLLLVDDEFETGMQLDDGFIKSISTENRIGANPKGKEEFTFVSRVVPFILTNSPPLSKDTSEALADRALVFPFNNSVPQGQRDTHLGIKLLAERDAIFSRFCRAYGDLVKRGNWKFPKECSEAWTKWRSESNQVLTFLNECVVKAPGEHLPAVELWEAYQIWAAEETGEMSHRIAKTRNKFYTAVDSALNQSRARGGSEAYYVYRNIALKPGVRTDSGDEFTSLEDDLSFLD